MDNDTKVFITFPQFIKDMLNSSDSLTLQLTSEQYDKFADCIKDKIQVKYFKEGSKIPEYIIWK